MGKPEKKPRSLVFFIKRLTHGSAGANTINERALDFLCCVANIELDTFGDDDIDSPADFFPPLEETEFSPVTDAMLAQGWHLDGIQPPPAHLLYACITAPSLDDIKLCVELEFTEEGETLEDVKNVLDPLVVQVDFDPECKTPDGRFVATILFVSGGSPCLKDFAFKGITVFDVADDSPMGFPPKATLFLAHGEDLESAANRTLREKTQCPLLLIESMPDLMLAAEPSDEILLELAKEEEDDLSISSDGSIKIGPDGSWTANS